MFFRSSPSITRLGALVLIALAPVAMVGEVHPLGIFEGQVDIGTVLRAGSVEYHSASDTYEVRSSGANMWKGADDFHFVWKKVHGDVSLAADIAFVGATGNPHRKAVLMIRQSLDSNSAAVYVAVHGVGMSALQFRDATDADTHEIEFNVTAPTSVRIEKRGDFFYAFVSGKDRKLQPAGASTRLRLTGSFYIGIGVCAHDRDAMEKAVISNVKLDQLPSAAWPHSLLATLETVDIRSTDRHVEYIAAANFQAPNWSRDGSFLVFNQDHMIHLLKLGSSEPSTIDTAPQKLCNDDHGISPDGKWLAISDRGAEDCKSHVYVLPLAGGKPRQVTRNGPSYFHGWSPDGKTIVFTGERGGNFDIYTIPASGGDETRLTTVAGVDDGPEYSQDGAYIFFHSDRTGQMQIWRMKADGSDQQQLILDDRNDWFPHISPDGQWMVFLAYGNGVSGHPSEMDVELRLYSLREKTVRVLAKLFGGNGTINSSSWSPDSCKVAFVSYEELPQEVPVGR